MEVAFKPWTRRDGVIPRHIDKRSLAKAYNAVVVVAGRPVEVVKARMWGTPSRSYCAVWSVQALPSGQFANWRVGFGTASGYGYHRRSAAFENALHDAGISLDTAVAGVGDRAIEDAMIAIAQRIVLEATGEAIQVPQVLLIEDH